jgi:hypothetical protein
VAVGNALISGGVGSAPSYGKIGLATHVSGTLPVANGGTGVTSSTGTGSVVLSASPTLTTPALGTPSALVGTNITGTASGLSIGGNAATATTATTATTANALNTANSYTAVTYTATGGRSSFTAVSEPFAVGAKYSSGGGSVYFGASDGTGTPGIQLSFATGAAALSISTAGVVSGTSFSGAGTGLTGTASGLTAGNVTTNANLTGDVTSVGNATSIAAGVIVNADINASAGIVDTKLATISTASKVSNSATTATSANTASAIVARDASGNFTAGTVTAALSGNATTATTATTATNQSGGTVSATTGSFSGQLSVAQSSTLIGNGINLNAAGSGYLRGTNNDGNSSTIANVQLMSWDGIGFSPSITGQTVPQGENAVWISCRTGTLNARSTITGASFSGAGTGLTGTAASLSIGGNAATVTNGLYTTGGQTVAARNTQQGSQTATLLTATGSLGGLEMQSAGASGAAFMTFHRPGAYASYFGIDTDNQFAVGGWSAGAALTNMKVGSFGVGTAASGTAGEIRATNNITAYYSDDRFKTNLGNIPDALAKVLTLNGFYYEANELAQSYGYEKKLEVGVSAQQVQAVQPEVVAPAPIDEDYLTVRYERLVPLLIEAIKELNAKVTTLEQVVAKSTQG